MKSKERNDSLDNFIRQTIGKEPLLPFPRTPDGPVQWIQLLNAIEQPDLPGWPLLTPAKVQMQKCEKCTREFCSPINYRRHIRVHRRSLNVNKEYQKNKDLLAAFWDKLSLEQAKEIVSFNDVMLKDIPGSSIITALASSLRKPGVWTLPQTYVKAGVTLLDIIQANSSRLPISSQELFSILDDASEGTFLCAGTAESVQNYVFDGETIKNSLELKNLVADASFLFEQQLEKAWVVDQSAEALRCQKLLVEEEEAAQKRQAVLLERKRQKKLRQREQKMKEQFYGSSGDLNVHVDAVERPTSAEASRPSLLSDFNSNSTDEPTNLDAIPPKNKESDEDTEAQIDFSNEHMEQGDSQTIDLPEMDANARHGSAPQIKESDEDTEAQIDFSNEHIEQGDSQSIDLPVMDANARQGSAPQNKESDEDTETQIDFSNERMEQGDSQTIDLPEMDANARHGSAPQNKKSDEDAEAQVDFSNEHMEQGDSQTIDLPVMDAKARHGSAPQNKESDEDSEAQIDFSNEHMEQGDTQTIDLPAPQNKESDEGTEAQIDFSNEHMEQGDSQTIDLPVMDANARHGSTTNRKQSPKSPRGDLYGNHASPNLQTVRQHGPAKGRSLQCGSKVWTKKLKNNSDTEKLKSPSSQVVPGHQIEQGSGELIIGSMPVTLQGCVAKQQESHPEEQDTCSTEPVIPEEQDTCSSEPVGLKKRTASEKLMRSNSLQSGTNRVVPKIWRPVIYGETKNLSSVDRSNEDCRQSHGFDNRKQFGVLSDDNAQQERFPFSIDGAKEFLDQRWKEAISGEHVQLELSSVLGHPGSDVTDPPQSSIPGDDDDENARNVQVQSAKKPEKSTKFKYIPKQKDGDQ